jgi:hypothetical protein
MVGVLRNVLSVSEYTRLMSEQYDMRDLEWVEKVPAPDFYRLIPELLSILDERTGETELRFPYARIRDHLIACQMYVSYGKILIRPTIPPTRTHEPFARARQRVYMSATLGEGGELERLSGTESIERLPVPLGWDTHGIGRRLFFFPELSVENDEALMLTLQMIMQAERGLVLTPDLVLARELRGIIERSAQYIVFGPSDLEQSKEAFIRTKNAVALLANRYEGIDFVENECRLLVVAGITQATNLQEWFLIARTGSLPLYNDRILTRIVQAVGRCTRSPNDYSAVVILGDKLSQFLLQPEKRRFFHPELQAELEFGIGQSRGVNAQDFLENLEIFLAQGSDWQDADANILELRNRSEQHRLPAVEALQKSVSHEVRYQYALWRGDYQEAVAQCRAALTHLSGDNLKGYRAFWNYLAGSAAWLGARDGAGELEQVAREFYRHAAGTAVTVRWLTKLANVIPEIRQEGVDNGLLAVVERLETVLEGLGTATDRKFENEVVRIFEGLTSQKPAEFEEGHRRLGILLGYDAGNSSSQAAPDPWWIAGEELCIVFEDHSGPEDPRATIGATKVRQAAAHPKWIRDNIDIAKTATIVPVLISPCSALEEGAESYTEDVRWWPLEEFRAWAREAIAVVRDLRRTFPGAGDLVWRARAAELYTQAGIAPQKFVENVLARRLYDLSSRRPKSMKS